MSAAVITYCHVTLHAHATPLQLAADEERREHILELAVEGLPALLAADADSKAATAAVTAVAVVAAMVAALQTAAAVVPENLVGASAEGLEDVYEDPDDVAPDVALLEAELAGVSAL
jgi:uncharacterized protein YfaQ (DUF2300 family)